MRRVVMAITSLILLTVPMATLAQTATPTPTPWAKAKLTREDAGTGDGSFYLYVETVNQTANFYDFVTVDVTCYDVAISGD